MTPSTRWANKQEERIVDSNLQTRTRDDWIGKLLFYMFMKTFDYNLLTNIRGIIVKTTLNDCLLMHKHNYFQLYNYTFFVTSSCF